jgi:hypothetical protein
MSGSTQNDGGPAFPHEADYIRNEGGGYEFKVDFHAGMTLRDWFAGQALTAIPLKDDGKRTPHEDRKQEAMWVATAAYRYADAMLAARERGAK